MCVCVIGILKNESLRLIISLKVFNLLIILLNGDSGVILRMEL